MFEITFRARRALLLGALLSVSPLTPIAQADRVWIGAFSNEWADQNWFDPSEINPEPIGWDTDVAFFYGSSVLNVHAGSIGLRAVSFNSSGYTITGSMNFLNAASGSLGPGEVLITEGVSTTFDANVASSIPITKIGAGTLVLNGNNNLTSDLIVQNGTVELGLQADNALGTSTAIVFSTLELNRNTITNDLVLIGGTLRTTNSFNSDWQGSVTLNNATYSTIELGTTGGLRVSGTISGGGALIMRNSGPLNGGLTISGNNTYTGGTTLDANVFTPFGTGGVTYQHVNAFGTGAITVASDSGIRSGVDGTISNHIIHNATTLTFDTDGHATTLIGGIEGSGGLVKVGAGTLTLDAINEYAGGTTVNGGTLVLGNTTGPTGIIRGELSIGSSATVVASAANWSLGRDPNACVSGITIDRGTLHFLDAPNGGTAASVITMTGGLISGSRFDWYNSITSNPTLTVLPSDTTSTISSGITLRLGSANNLTFDVAAGTSPSGIDLLFSGSFDQGDIGGGIIKTGAGTMVLTGGSTLNGGTTVNQGRLSMTSGAVLVQQGMTINAGAFEQEGGDNTISAPLNIRGGGAYTLLGGSMHAPTIDIRDSGSIMSQAAGWANTDTLNVGFSTNVSVIPHYVLGGGELRAGNTFVGPTGYGRFVQSGGTNYSSGLWIGNSPSANAGYTLSGGLVETTGTTVAGLGTAFFVQNGGTHRTGDLRIAGQNFGPNIATGSYSLAGGILETVSISRGEGNATFRFDGGTLKAAANTSNLFSNFSPVVAAGGAVFDTNGFNATINSAILHDAALGATLDGGLIKRGAGTLTLNGANTYTGRTLIEAGTLEVKQAFAASILTGSGADFRDGAKLVIDYTGGTSPAATIRAQLAASFPSFATGQYRFDDANPFKGLGWLDDASSSEFIIRATYYGDWDLSGTVDFDDLLDLAQAYGTSGATWSKGDSNYDGVVNFGDLLSLAQNYGKTLLADATTIEGSETFNTDVALAFAMIPEPGTLGLVSGVSLLMWNRRRYSGQ